MKKSLFIFAFTCISFTAFSQIKVSPGFRGGANISNVTNSNGDSNTDFYIGGFIGVKLARFYTLQPELTYSRQGAEIRFSYIEPYYGNLLFGNENLEIQYLNFTIANKFHPIPDIGLNFILGPSFNIKVADNYDNGYENIQGFDFALFGGIGFEFPFGLGLEARYNQGFIDIFGYEYDNYEDDYYFDELYLNSYFQIGATYKFNF